MEKVTSIEHLKKLCNINGRAEFHIYLAGGLCRSSKEIYYDNKTNKFDIYNDIDESWQEDVDEKALYEKTMIPAAIDKGVFYFKGIQLWGIE